MRILWRIEIVDNLFSLLSYQFTLLNLSEVVSLHTLVSLSDDLFLHKLLGLLELSVPILKLGQAFFNASIGSYISPVALSHVKLLIQLVQLALDQFVVNAVNDEIFKLPHIVNV
jgi:hypothetical protein